MSFFSTVGLLSDKDPYVDTENVSLWIVEFALLQSICGKNYGPKLFWALGTLTDGTRWYPCEDHSKFAEEGFSRDNMIAITSAGVHFSREEYAKAGMKCFDIPRYLQPQDIIFFGYTAKKWWSYPLLPFLCLNMLWACWEMPKCGNGGLDTDGKILTFVRLMGCKHQSWWLTKTWILANKILAKRLVQYLEKNPKEIDEDTKGKHHWRVIFRMYFRDINHPINQLCAYIWK